MKALNSISYPIYFENTLTELVNFINQGNYSRFFVLTDENTGKHCLPLIRKYIDKLDNFDIIGQGPGNNFREHVVTHVTFNANGTITANVDDFRATCN